MAVAPTQETGSVEEAKRRLREASAGFDPYALVRARPLSCAGGAFLLGLGWKWLRPGRAVPALAMLSLQLVDRALAQNLAARGGDHGVDGNRAQAVLLQVGGDGLGGVTETSADVSAVLAAANAAAARTALGAVPPICARWASEPSTVSTV